MSFVDTNLRVYPYFTRTFAPFIHVLTGHAFYGGSKIVHIKDPAEYWNKITFITLSMASLVSQFLGSLSLIF